MSTIKQSELVEFVNLTSGASYDADRKKRYQKLGKRILKAIAAQIGLSKGEFDIRWNPGGIAVSGDHTLHTDKFYLALHDNCGVGWFYWRTCNGRRDFAGGPNQLYYWTTLTAYGIDLLVVTLREVQFPS